MGPSQGSATCFAPKGGIAIDYLVLFLMILSFFCLAIAYSRAKVKSAVLLAVVFYVSNFWLTYNALFDSHRILFCCIVAVLILLPVVCLLLFGLDVKYALFCLDTSYAVAIAWGLAPFLCALSVLLSAWRWVEIDK